MRILFNNGEQKKFIDQVCKKINITLRKLSIDYKKELKVSYSSMKKYRNERLLMPLNVASFLSEKSDVNWKNFNFKEVLEDNWGWVKGGKIGYNRMSKKYSKKLKFWRSKGGRNCNIKHPFMLAGRNVKNIKFPKIDEKLAEFIGICLGDGTLTKYFLRISFDSRYEAPYAKYVSSLCQKLFRIKPVLRKEKNKNLMYIELSSVKACKFLNINCHLPFGDKIKNEAKIPDFIFKSKNLTISCLRGLIDTDGSVRDYVYFSSHDNPLLKQVEEIGKNLGIFTSGNDTLIGTGVWSKVIRYFRIIGSSNLKHIVRFHKMLKENKFVYVKDVCKYYDEYKNMYLPFKTGSMV